MSIKQRIWRLSLMAILGSVVGTAATFVMASAASRTIDAAGAAGSSLDDLYVMQSSLGQVEETFKYAVSASDKSALEKTTAMAQAFREKTADLATLTESQPVAGQLGKLFDSYYSSAFQATGIMLGVATGDTTSVIQAMQESQQGLHKALASAREDLTHQFDDNLARAGSRVHVQVLISLLVGLCVAAAIVITSRRLMPAIVNPIEQTVRVLADIESGNLDTQVTSTSDDEMGKVLTSLDAMRKSLKERTEREHQSALENARIRSALDCVAVSAMLVDTSGTVIYANDSLNTLFAQRARDLATRWPALGSGKVVGSTMAAFRGVQALEHGQLSRLSGREATDLEVGSAQLRIVANPVKDGSGARVGTVVQWTDRSQEVAAEREVQDTVAKALEGDLTVRLNEAGEEGFFRTLASGVNSLLENMSELLRTMTNAAAALKGGAEDIAAGNQNLAKRTEEQAASLEETASSMEQMTSTVKNTADNAGQANQLATAARKQAETGGSVVGAAISAMSEINDSSRKIGDIIGVINDIAFQTNLLALNAAVEAARAGEQGRGFAVVATEVRSLAGRSATAAKEIKSLIEDSVQKVDEGSRLVNESGKALGQIVTSVKKVTDIVSEIAAGTQEQSAGIAQVNREVMQMDQATQQNASLVHEAAAAGRAIAEQVDALTSLVARYTVTAASGGARREAHMPAEGAQSQGAQSQGAKARRLSAA